MKKLIILLSLICLVNGVICAQAIQRRVLDLPEVDGYELLKCDFHLHTVFSDGYVWPTVRVDEAITEGLDAIALTEHIELRTRILAIDSTLSKISHNIAYDMAKKQADAAGVILIKGAEITRAMPPGHFNAIFLPDANPLAEYVNPENKLDGSNIVETLAKAKELGAFVFWNHPWFQNPQNIAEWMPIHEELYQKGLITGVEVINATRYDAEILKWCLDKDLTILSNTDAHHPVTPGLYGYHRTMTIVFAKEKSEAGIREALENRRSVAYLHGHIYGKEEFIRPLFENAIEVDVHGNTDGNAYLILKNNTSIEYSFRIPEKPQDFRIHIYTDKVVVPAKGQIVLILSGEGLKTGNRFDLKVEVENAHVGPDKRLISTISFVK